uniref:C2H2-type domain-containing protein n=1 Tax=Trichogramma kaykai TaxID=54128 RepID=A0ABD2WTG7_9HYME
MFHVLDKQKEYYVCHRCGRSYTFKSNMMRHQRLECGVEPRFQCPECPKRFKHRHHLDDHRLKHRLTREREERDPLEFDIVNE